MRALSAVELISIWEHGAAQSPVRRALDLLVAACPELTPDELAALSIGRRDTWLMALREWTFGSRLVSLATCPACDERVELDFDLAEVRVAPPEQLVDALWVAIDGYDVRFRLPDSRDLAALSGELDARIYRQRLLARCVLGASRQGAAQTAEQLPDHVVAAVAERMASADPQADVQLALDCPACGQQWRLIFDIVSFFWAEIEAWAYRTLHEVHLLARAYGWREPDILAISPWRRRYYLEMLADERLSR
jgi:hypothetical protein